MTAVSWTTLDDLDRDRMVELWRDRERASTDFERGYAQGRFEEYASQNAIDPDLFPVLRAEASVRALQERNALRAMSGHITDDERRELADAYRKRDALLQVQA